MADVVTDREQINDIIHSRLSELDDIRSKFQAAEHAVGEAERRRDNLADEYAEKIEAFIETGWATRKGLSGQGHSLPKGRSRRRRTNTEPESQSGDTTAEESSL
ncbi:hypothetical protein BKG82_26520 [Mycobacteroides chelonae]|uniref:Uncharacterized protein n=1 Tax=Mycobacteroides chelonae TaxID=1774 RepID=A0A1S1LC44_MYCCH|nr:hypothetical protein [Mycobacteroides chelonae]OHU47213.1 hypothetical protein BKG82_26520 [Mycobacteroides chelonae]